MSNICIDQCSRKMWNRHSVNGSTPNRQESLLKQLMPYRRSLERGLLIDLVLLNMVSSGF